MTIFSFLLSLYLVLLPLTGRFLTGYLENIFFFIPPVFFISYLLIKKPRSAVSPHPKIIIIELVLTFLYLLSCIFSKNPGSSFPQFFIWINSWLIINIFIISQPSEKILLPIIEIAAIIYSLIYFFHPFPLPLDNIFDSSLPPCQLADFLIFAIPITFFYYRPQIKIFKPILIIFFLAVIITSSSRSAVISLLLGFEIFHHFQPLPLFSKFRLFFYLLVIGFLGIYFIFPDHFRNKTGLGSRQLYTIQAFHGFKENPVLGIGPANFMYVSLKYGSTDTGATQFAHSSFLQYISENGIIFTTFVFGFIFYCLFEKKSKKSLFFCLGIIGLINSAISTTGWNSPGIFILSLVFILKDFHQSKFSLKTTITLFITSIILVTFCSKNLISLHYQNTGDYYRSLDYNQFNLNSRIEIIKQFHDPLNSYQLFDNNYYLFQTLAENTPLPQGEDYYYKAFSLNPHGITHLYLQLFKYYSENNQSEKLKYLIKITQNNKAVLDYQSYLKSRIAAIPFPKNEDYYYQLFDISRPNTNTTFYLDLLNNYIKQSQKQLPTIFNLKSVDYYIEPSEQLSPRFFSLLYIIKRNFLYDSQVIAPTKNILAEKIFILSIKLLLTQSEVSLEYIRAANELDPIKIGYKIELATNLLWQSDNQNNNYRWEAYKTIYDCINDSSKIVSYRCRQYLETYPQANSFPGRYFYIDPYSPYSP